MTLIAIFLLIDFLARENGLDSRALFYH